jgi:hypothetical protein
VVICEHCFAFCHSLKVISIESDSKLSRIERKAFYRSGLTSIHLPASVVVIYESCFLKCTSLGSLTIDRGSKLCESQFSAPFRARFADAFSGWLDGAGSAVAVAVAVPIAVASANANAMGTEVVQDYREEDLFEDFGG